MTSYLIFHRGKPVAQDIASILINGRPNAIRRATYAKFLGIMVDEKLSFRSDSYYIVTKLLKYIYI